MELGFEGEGWGQARLWHVRAEDPRSAPNAASCTVTVITVRTVRARACASRHAETNRSARPDMFGASSQSCMDQGYDTIYDERQADARALPKLAQASRQYMYCPRHLPGQREAAPRSLDQVEGPIETMKGI